MTTPTVLASRLLVRARMRHLHVFLKVAELGSLNRAAEAVGLTQPSATHVLSDLEQLLECALFQRHARGMIATPTALALLPLARRMLDTVADWAELTAAMTAHASGVVRVAGITGAVTGLLAPHLPEFARAHPDVLVQVREGDIEQIADWISAHMVDLVLCREPATVPAGWAFGRLLSDELVVVAGPDHPLARRSAPKWDELWRCTWLHGVVASAPRRAFDQLTTAAGVAPPLRLVGARAVSVAWAMLRAEPLLFLVPRSIVSQLLDAGQLVCLDIAVPVPIEPIGVLAPLSNLGSAAQTLLDYLGGIAAAQAQSQAPAQPSAPVAARRARPRRSRAARATAVLSR